MEVGHQRVEGDTLKVAFDARMLLQMEEKGLCSEQENKVTLRKTMLKLQNKSDQLDMILFSI